MLPLLEAGADANSINSQGRSAFFDAVIIGCNSSDARVTQKAPLAADADINYAVPRTGLTVLQEAIIKRRNDKVKFLLDAGENYNIATKNTDMLLTLARNHESAYGYGPKVVKMLIEAGATEDR